MDRVSLAGGDTSGVELRRLCGGAGGSCWANWGLGEALSRAAPWPGRLAAMRVFVAVVDARGFSAASRALCIPLPTVSRKIAELERHLGAQLLIRSTRRSQSPTVGSVTSVSLSFQRNVQSDRHSMSPLGYNLPSEPPPRHVCNGPRFGHSGRDVRFRTDYFRFVPRFGRS